MTRHYKQGRKSMTGSVRTRKSSFMASPHGAALTYSRHDSFGGSSTDIERLLLRRVDRVSKVEVPVGMDDAIGETGHGRFQKCLWVICGLIYACCSISTTTLSFVLPAACDFHLTAGEKGLMNIMPVAGMMIGSYFWGFFADSKGRRFVLVCSLMIDGLAGMFSSLCQEKKMFLVIRVFNGFGIIGSVSVVFAYLGEFLTDSKRDKALASLELWWTFGIVSEPVIGYLVIPRRYVFGEPGVFIYDSWRLYVFLCGLPSVIMGLIMIKMPESPRFLLLQGKLIKSRNVLQFMFNFNHGKHSGKEYPVKVLQPSAQTEFYFFKSMHDISAWAVTKETMSGIWKLHVFLFQNCLKNIILTSYIDFGLMFSYNTLINWIPELLNNVNHFEKVHGTGYTLCDVQEYKNSSNASSNSFQHTAFFGTFVNPVLSDVNHRHMQHHWGFYRAAVDPSCQGVSLSVYLETFFVCLCCLPTTIATYYCIQHISKKIILVTELLVAGLVTILVTMVKKGEHLFFLMCMFEAFTTVVEAVLFCIVVEIFPDQVRGIALCLTVTIGRFGAVVGNFIFGELITTNCRLPFSFFSFLFFTGCIAVLCFPKLKLGH